MDLPVQVNPSTADDLLDMLFNKQDGVINTELLSSMPSKSLDMPTLSFVSLSLSLWIILLCANVVYTFNILSVRSIILRHTIGQTVCHH